MTDIDQLKEMWGDLNRRLEKLENQTIEDGRRITSGKIRTAKSDLTSTYKKFMIIGFGMGVVFPLFLLFTTSDFYPEGTSRFVSAGLFFLFFMTSAVMDAHLYNEVKCIDLAVMSVRDVIDRARTLKRRHHIFMMILIPLAIVTLVAFAIPILSDKSVIVGMITGGSVGLIIGLRQYFRMMRDYREMMQEYAE